MSARHSPGPWTALVIPPAADDPVGTARVLAPGGLAIDCDLSGRSRDEAAANAQLVAAAPEMHELLEAAWDAYRGDPCHRSLAAAMNRIEALLWRLDGNE